MSDPNTQRGDYKQDIKRSAEENKIHHKTFEAAEGSYEARSMAAQAAVREFRHKILQTRWAKEDIAKHASSEAPMPESGKVSANLAKLSQEKVTTWLDQYKNDLREALTKMFGLEPQFSMTDVEWVKFLEELRDPSYREQKTFFTLTDWISRIERGSGKKAELDESVAIDTLLSSIASNKPLEEVPPNFRQAA